MQLAGIARRQTAMAVCGLVAVVAGLACNAASESKRSSDSGSADTGSRPSMSAKMLPARLQEGMEARDEQQFATFGPARDSGGKSILVVVDKNGAGTVIPSEEIGQFTAEEFEDAEPSGGIFLALVTVTGGAGETLWPDGTDSLFLHHTNTPNSWWATIHVKSPGAPIPLNVTRFVYPKKNLNPSLDDDQDFPATARWDWADINGKQQLVIGVPCDHGWCLVGVQDPYTADSDDPLDTRVNVNATRRVRGWYDRQYNTLIKKWIFVYPQLKLRKLARRNFQKQNNNANPRLVATIVVEGNPDKQVFLFDPQTDPADKYPWNETIGANNQLFAATRTSKPGVLMPGAARWSSSISEGRLVKSRTVVDLGDMWVRCASGCCDAILDGIDLI